MWWVLGCDIFVVQSALHRMVGYWDRYHEQNLFELEFIPYIDNRELEQCSCTSPVFLAFFLAFVLAFSLAFTLDFSLFTTTI
jgi:hypothetical protein